MLKQRGVLKAKIMMLSRETIQRIREFMGTLRHGRTVLMALSVFVVFVTSYALVLNARTLDQEAARAQGGIDTAQAQEMSFAGDGDR